MGGGAEVREDLRLREWLLTPTAEQGPRELSEMQTHGPEPANRIRMDGGQVLEFCLNFSKFAYSATDPGQRTSREKL